MKVRTKEGKTVQKKKCVRFSGIFASVGLAIVEAMGPTGRHSGG